MADYHYLACGGNPGPQAHPHPRAQGRDTPIPALVHRSHLGEHGLLVKRNRLATRPGCIGQLPLKSSEAIITGR